MSSVHNPLTFIATNSHLLLHIFFHFLIVTNLICFTRAQADNYIVHMDLAAMPKPFFDHHSWYKSILDSISTTSQQLRTTTTTTNKLLYTYNHAIHGFSARLTPSELETLKSSPGYLHSTRDSPVTLDTTHTPKFLGLSPLSGAWPASDYGNDVIIGLVDTGIWPESRSFNDDGFTPVPSRWKGTCESGTQFNSSMCNRKLIGAQYFNKALLASDPKLNISMNSARDTFGHGTHTSSTAAGAQVDDVSYFGYARGNAVGMAPRARVAMYKAQWEEGGDLADILAALDKAIADGVDVISISLGVNVDNIVDDVLAIGSFAAIQKGIFVSLSAGNRGPNLGTLHNGTPWALTVASGITDRRLGGTITLGNGVSLNGLSLYPESTTPKKASVTLMNECNDLKALKKLRNDTVVVCLDFNGTAIENQLYQVGQVKVAGGIFITKATDLDLQAPTYPAMFLGWETGKALMDYIKSSSDVKPTATFDLQKTYLGSGVSPKLASYSSRGPSPTIRAVLKPDLMAPGTQILASWARSSPVTFTDSGPLYNDFNIISGTSMACPHASGVAALLKGAHPEWTPAMIRSAMMTSADTLDSSGGPIQDLGTGDKKASALGMGAGHVNPNKAMEPGLVYDAEYRDYVDLLCALNYTESQMKAITRSSDFNCSTPSDDLNYPSFVLFVRKGSEPTEKMFWRTVMNVGEGAAIYTLKVVMVEGVEVRVEPEKLVFREKYEKVRFKVAVKVVGKMEKVVVDGSISWIDREGRYVVRSPILVTSFI